MINVKNRYSDPLWPRPDCGFEDLDPLLWKGGSWDPDPDPDPRQNEIDPKRWITGLNNIIAVSYRESGLVASAASDWTLDLATYPMSVMIAAGGISAALFGKWTMKVKDWFIYINL